MQKIESQTEIFIEKIVFNTKKVIDIGCGVGEMSRWMQQMGAIVTGIDKPEIIEQALKNNSDSGTVFLAGTAEHLPFENHIADIITCFASFHHIPTDLMNTALLEFKRVLKNGGMIIFLEPVAEKGSWYEVTRFYEEEEFARWVAYEAIKNFSNMGFTLQNEEFYYMERSLEHFKTHLDIYVTDDQRKKKIIAQAESRFIELATKAGIPAAQFSLKSIIRLNILIKEILKQ
jgi:ubiquinone/menaquinone biosynthesis C-methylase UbiE